MSSPTQTRTPDFSNIGPQPRTPPLVRLALRGPLIAAIVCATLLEPLFRRQNTEQTPHTVAKWTRRILKLANVELQLEGAIPDGPGLFVSNHRSYIDILVVLAHLPATFLCKKEVRAWPLIGRVAEKMGVVFVDRSSAASRLASLTLITSTVIQGQRVVAFPEGTTTRGPGMRATYPGLFREAERQRFAIFPMVIEYADPEDAWVDDDTLLRHLTTWLSKPVTRVKVSFGPPILPGDTTDLQQRAEAWMRGELARLHHYPW